MLEYEKKLHLDEHYKKMQTLSGKRGVWDLLLGAIEFAAVYLLARYLLIGLPDLRPWDGGAVCLTAGSMKFCTADVVYFCLGLTASCYGAVRLGRITRQNHSVREGKSAPTKLLTDGCYAQVRHPMYGVFAIRQAALLLALRSLIGLLLACAVVAFQSFNAAWEEKRKL